jgi:hypothetical protein
LVSVGSAIQLVEDDELLLLEDDDEEDDEEDEDELLLDEVEVPEVELVPEPDRRHRRPQGQPFPPTKGSPARAAFRSTVPR